MYHLMWTLQYQASFEMLKDALITSPILKYPDPNKPYTLFTDASKHANVNMKRMERYLKSTTQSLLQVAYSKEVN